MDFSLTDEEEQLGRAVRSFLDDRYGFEFRRALVRSEPDSAQRSGRRSPRIQASWA
jgi:hypothetical protein